MIKLLEPEVLSEKFAETEFAVHATRFEKDTLYQSFSDKVEWLDSMSHSSVNICVINSNPVVVHFEWSFLNKHLVMFYQFYSNIRDLKASEAWIIKHCPKLIQGNSLYMTNAANFHLALGFVNT